MNRNMMYEYLKEKGLYAIFVHRKDGKTYHTEFRLQPHQEECTLITEWGYIRHIYSIHLCQNEIVVESKFGDMKVNIKYSRMEKFEIQIYEKEYE